MVNFTVSYDYELFWGMHRNLKESYMRNSISNANSAALQIFNLHEKLEFPATWAVVGIAVDNPCSQEEYEYFLKHYKGTISAEMLKHFLESFAQTCRITLHVHNVHGENNHHKVESSFKALGVAMRHAVAKTGTTDTPSTKGLLA